MLISLTLEGLPGEWTGMSMFLGANLSELQVSYTLYDQLYSKPVYYSHIGNLYKYVHGKATPTGIIQSKFWF